MDPEAVNGARTDARTAEEAASKAREKAADRQIAAQQQAEQAARAADRRARDADARDRKAAERAADWQREMALERRRECVEKIGELVEDIFWTLAPPDGGDGPGQDLSYQRWMPERNRIGHLLVGLSKNLPECANLLNDATASSALGHARLGREEVRLELERIDGALYLTRNPQYYTNAAGQLLAGKRIMP